MNVIYCILLEHHTTQHTYSSTKMNQCQDDRLTHTNLKPTIGYTSQGSVNGLHAFYTKIFKETNTALKEILHKMIDSK